MAINSLLCSEGKNQFPFTFATRPSQQAYLPDVEQNRPLQYVVPLAFFRGVLVRRKRRRRLRNKRRGAAVNIWTSDDCQIKTILALEIGKSTLYKSNCYLSVLLVYEEMGRYKQGPLLLVPYFPVIIYPPHTVCSLRLYFWPRTTVLYGIFSSPSFVPRLFVDSS